MMTIRKWHGHAGWGTEMETRYGICAPALNRLKYRTVAIATRGFTWNHRRYNPRTGHLAHAIPVGGCARRKPKVSMEAVLFDTMTFVDTLRYEGNMPEKQAKAVAKAVGVALHQGVATHEDITDVKTLVSAVDARVTILETKMEAGFSTLETRMNAGLSGLETRMKAGLSDLETKMNTGLSGLEAKMDASLSSLEAKVDGQKTSLEAKMDGQKTSLEAKITTGLSNLEGKMDGQKTSLDAKLKIGFMHSEVGRLKSALHPFRAQPG